MSLKEQGVKLQHRDSSGGQNATFVILAPRGISGLIFGYSVKSITEVNRSCQIWTEGVKLLSSDSLRGEVGEF